MVSLAAKEYLESIPSWFLRKRLVEHCDLPQPKVDLYLYKTTPKANSTAFTEKEILTELLRRAQLFDFPEESNAD